MNEKVLNEDLSHLLTLDYIPYQKLKNKNILITGCTGLVGYNMLNALVFLSKNLDLNLTIHAIVRDKTKLKEIFSDQLLSYDKLFFIQEEIKNYKDENADYDYILHIASPTASKDFVTHAVEVIDFAYGAAKNLLELARMHNSTFVYFSSLEVYGSPSSDDKIAENYISSCPDTMSSRSSYSEGKRICETLSRSYFEEYGVPVFILRLTQTFGPGVKNTDNRVFAQFARACRNGEDIILKSTGESKKSYLYTMDMVSAVLTIILKGHPGEAYNIANEETYCSIKDMAEMACEKLSQNKSSIIFDISKESMLIYPPKNTINLDCSKLRSLRWSPSVDLYTMFIRMMESWEEQ